MPDGGLGLGDGNTIEDVIASQKAEKDKAKADGLAKATANKEAAAKAEADKGGKGAKSSSKASTDKKKKWLFLRRIWWLCQLDICIMIQLPHISCRCENHQAMPFQYICLYPICREQGH